MLRTARRSGPCLCADAFTSPCSRTARRSGPCHRLLSILDRPEVGSLPSTIFGQGLSSHRERRAPWSDLIWLPVQRFGYRQLMYYVVVKSIDTALHGGRVSWGKLERKATAAVGRGG